MAIETKQNMIDEINSLMKHEMDNHDKLRRSIELKREYNLPIDTMELLEIGESSGKIQGYREMLFRLTMLDRFSRTQGV